MPVIKPPEHPHMHRLTWSERIGMNLMNVSFCWEKERFYGLGNLCQEPTNAPQVHPGRRGHIFH